MDRTLFTERMNTISTMSDIEINKVIIDTINSNIGDGNPRGHRNLIIAVEELAELAQQVSKSLRNKEDITALLEESADVVLCIKYIQEIFGITDDELNKAVSVKVERMSNVIEQDGVYL